MAHPYPFGQVMSAVCAVLEAIRPEGSAEFPQKGPIVTSIRPEFLGKDVAAGVLSAARDPMAVNAGLPPEEQNLDRERLGERVNALLGPVAARIKVPDPSKTRRQKEKSQ